MSFLLSLFGGSALGFLGGLFKGVFDYLSTREKNKQELEMKRLDIEMMDKEWQYRERIAQTEGEVRVEESADSLVRESYKQDASTYSKPGMAWFHPLVFVDAIRGIIRPGITVYLGWLIYDTRTEVKKLVDALTVRDMQDIVDMYGRVNDTILYLGVTAIGWWFGDRTAKAMFRRK